MSGKNWNIRDLLLAAHTLPAVESLVAKFSRDTTVLEVIYFFFS